MKYKYVEKSEIEDIMKETSDIEEKLNDFSQNKFKFSFDYQFYSFQMPLVNTLDNIKYDLDIDIALINGKPKADLLISKLNYYFARISENFGYEFILNKNKRRFFTLIIRSSIKINFKIVSETQEEEIIQNNESFEWISFPKEYFKYFDMIDTIFHYGYYPDFKDEYLKRLNIDDKNYYDINNHNINNYKVNNYKVNPEIRIVFSETITYLYNMIFSENQKVWRDE